MDHIKVTSPKQLQSFVGQEIAVGPWVRVTQQMVDSFAAATGDHQFIHVDPVRAAATAFGGTIAHGYLLLSLLSGHLARDRQGLELCLNEKMRINYGLGKVRFLTPVPVGKRVRSHVKLQTVGEDPGQKWLQVHYEQKVELEGADRPAVIGETITRFVF